MRLAYDSSQISYGDLLKVFWENHDPTQGMRQGNDVGSQYRSGVYTYGDEQETLAQETRDRFQDRLTAAGHGPITCASVS